MFFFFFSGGPNAPSIRSVSRSFVCVYAKTSLFFTCLLSRCDSYNVLLLFITAINQRAFNYQRGEEGFERTPRLPLDIFRVD